MEERNQDSDLGIPEVKSQAPPDMTWGTLLNLWESVALSVKEE